MIESIFRPCGIAGFKSATPMPSRFCASGRRRGCRRRSSRRCGAYPVPTGWEERMQLAFWCVLAMGVMPVATVAIAKWKGLDNHAPRDWAQSIDGYRRRAYAAHLNHFEAFPLFAAAVLVAATQGAPMASVNVLAAGVVACPCCLYRLLRGGRRDPALAGVGRRMGADAGDLRAPGVRLTVHCRDLPLRPIEPTSVRMALPSLIIRRHAPFAAMSRLMQRRDRAGRNSMRWSRQASAPGNSARSPSSTARARLGRPP